MRHDDDDLQEEIRAHLAMAARDRIADGADPEAARQAAVKEFGNVTLIREAARRVWVPSWFDVLSDLMSDVRQAVRALAKHPIFSMTVIGVLTVGIAVNAAVFTMMKSVALTPLSGIQNSAGLRVIFGETSAGRAVGISYPDYQYLRERSTTTSGLYGHRLLTVTVGRGRNAHQASAEAVTGNYFHVLRVRAQLGRTLQMSDETAPGRPSVAVISNGLWRRDFAADPDIVGKTLEINNKVLTIVGVADPTFHGTIVSYDVDLFVPLMIAPDLGITFGSSETTASGVLSDQKAAVLFVFGWLKPGATMAQATAEVDAIWSDLSRDRPVDGGVTRLGLVPFRGYPGSGQATVLPVLMALSAMGLLVLVIACANIGGLVVVRGVSRRGELGLRLALGASRARIVRLLLVESLVLAVPGAILGVALATRVMPVLIGYAELMAAPQRLFFNMQTDALLIGFAAAVAVVSALVFGFLPSLQSSRIDLVSVMKEDGPRGTTRGRLRSSLVIAQVAVSLLLLVGAGLVTRSLEAAQRADRGYSEDRVTAIALDLKANGYDEPRGRVFYRRLLDTARALPGAESASLAMYVPMAFLETRASKVAIDGHERRRDEDLSMLTNVIAPQYFQTLRIPMVAGREFDDHDDGVSAPVAVVNRTLAEKYWGGAANAVGRKVRVTEGAWRTVVGVAADVKYIRINEAPRSYIYLPFLQSYRPAMVLHTRGSGPVDALVEQARLSIATLDPELPIVSARSLADETRGALIVYTFMSSMLFLFGTAGIALAALGTYGLVSYTVKQSTHEIGIRMVLGASGCAVVRGFLGRGLRLGAIGAVIGALAALGVGRVLRNVIFGVSATDGFSFAQALAIVLAVVLAATLVPAWRASRTDPLKALRYH
jgi:predicted permease